MLTKPGRIRVTSQRNTCASLVIKRSTGRFAASMTHTAVHHENKQSRMKGLARASQRARKLARAGARAADRDAKGRSVALRDAVASEGTVATFAKQRKPERRFVRVRDTREPDRQTRERRRTARIARRFEPEQIKVHGRASLAGDLACRVQQMVDRLVTS